MKNKLEMIYRRLGIVTIAAVYFLILVGGIVRSTGSGMGCPDWPKCFGLWIPPTEIGQLPPNYKEVFKVAGKEIADFNVFKTWTEYINRLIGVLIGFLIFLTFLFSIPYFRKDKWITLLSFFSVLLVGFQGWIGAKVVATDLSVGLITIHMFLAILLVFVLIYTITRSFKENIGDYRISDPKHIARINMILLPAIILSLVQIFLGTKVRESVDQVAKMFLEMNRESWIGELGIEFYIHRSFSLLILGVHLYLIYVLYQYNESKLRWIRNCIIALTALLLAETISGAMMAYFAIPAYLQPIHLFLANIATGIQFFVFLVLNLDSVFPVSALKKQKLQLTD